jgi:Homeodomain-like domain
VALAQLIITAVDMEGRIKSEVARNYGVSRYWVEQLVSRYQREGLSAFQLQSRRPGTIRRDTRVADPAVGDLVRGSKAVERRGCCCTFVLYSVPTSWLDGLQSLPD